MIYPEGRYNLNFDICAVIIGFLLFLYLVLASNLKVRRVRSFFWVVLCMIFCSAAELAMDIARNDNGINFTNIQAEIITFISHLAHNSIPYLLVLYFITLTGLWQAFRKRDILLLSIPEFILILCHLIPPIKNLIYNYHDAMNYTRGPLYCIYYIITGIYIACGIVILAVKLKSIEKHNILYVSLLVFGYLVGMVIGIFNTYLRMTNFIQVLVLSVCFFLLESDENKLDKPTGVYNILGLQRDAYPLFHAPYKSYILSVKLQDINNYRLMIGMDAMSQIIHQIGEWMLSLANENCRFYHVSPGEFAVLLIHADEKSAIDIAETIRSRFTKPWHYSDDKTDITIPTQVWVSSIPDRISNSEQVVAFSEASFNPALPLDKVYEANEIEEETRRLDVTVAIHRALTENTFEVYYQPIYDTKTKKIRCCEALVRMTDSLLGPVSPEEFIKVAEQTGSVSKIGSIVFEKVCQFISEKNPKQYGLEYVDVNLSPIQCMDQNLAQEFDFILKKYHVSPNQIVLEITESAIIHQRSKVNNVILDLQKIGFRFSLDDFGTGQANYSYVRDFPFSIIKIDKSFLWEAEKNTNDRIVLQNMLNLVKDLHLESVVEGVETQYQKEKLTQFGVNFLQGYYFSKPVNEEKFLAYIKDFNQKPNTRDD